jgi:hypothetical protein
MQLFSTDMYCPGQGFWRRGLCVSTLEEVVVAQNTQSHTPQSPLHDVLVPGQRKAHNVAEQQQKQYPCQGGPCWRCSQCEAVYNTIMQQSWQQRARSALPCSPRTQIISQEGGAAYCEGGRG